MLKLTIIFLYDVGGFTHALPGERKCIHTNMTAKQPSSVLGELKRVVLASLTFTGMHSSVSMSVLIQQDSGPVVPGPYWLKMQGGL